MILNFVFQVYLIAAHTLYLATLKPSFRRTSGLSVSSAWILLSNVDNYEDDRELNTESL